jgi:purine-binding chemotaxis protein CheW
MQMHTDQHTTTSHLPAPGKYLTFALGREEYGLPVLKVREIVKLMDITVVPQLPPHVKGIINLRGKVIPVIEVRRKFGLEDKERTDQTCIIVVQVAVGAERLCVGMIVDSVSEVLNVTADELDGMPTFGDDVRTDFVSGVAKVKGTVKMLLDLERVLGSTGEIASVVA